MDFGSLDAYNFLQRCICYIYMSPNCYNTSLYQFSNHQTSQPQRTPKWDILLFYYCSSIVFSTIAYCFLFCLIMARRRDNPAQSGTLDMFESRPFIKVTGKNCFGEIQNLYFTYAFLAATCSSICLAFCRSVCESVSLFVT